MHALTRSLLAALARNDGTFDDSIPPWVDAGCPDAGPTYTLKVERDPDPQSPEEWGNTDLFLVGRHRSFTVRSIDGVAALDASAFDGKGSHFAIPLYAYIHSGTHLFLRKGDADTAAGSHAGWDTCEVGTVLVSRTEWPEAEDALAAAQSLVAEWNTYLSGDVWGYAIEDEDGNVEDSCWGYYGEDAARTDGEMAFVKYTGTAS